MKTLWKLCLGVTLGLVASWLIVKQYGINWGSAGLCLLGSLACFVTWDILRLRKIRTALNKTIGCVLISTFAVSPWSMMAEDTYAGYSGQSCYCLQAASALESEDNVVVLNFIVDPIMDAPSPLTLDAVPRIISVHRPNPGTLVTWEQMAAIFELEGIDLNAVNSTQYAKNGQKCSPSDVPFILGGWSQSFTLYPEQKQYRVTVETTSEFGEFAHWQAVSQFSIPANTQIEYQDTPDGNTAFYRLRLEPSDTQQQGIFQPAGPILLGCGIGLLGGVGVVAVLTIRACARNKKKFEKMQRGTNASTARVNFNLTPVH